MDTFACRLLQAANTTLHNPKYENFPAWLVAQTASHPLVRQATADLFFPYSGLLDSDYSDLPSLIHGLAQGLLTPHRSLLQALAEVLNTSPQALIPSSFIPPARLLSQAMLVGKHSIDSLARNMLAVYQQAFANLASPPSLSAPQEPSASLHPLSAQDTAHWIRLVLDERLIAFPQRMIWIFPMAANYNQDWRITSRFPFEPLGLLPEPPETPWLLRLQSIFPSLQEPLGRLYKRIEQRYIQKHYLACWRNRHG